jgi:hypothetical protein
MGYCAGFPAPGFMNPFFGFGRGFGFGTTYGPAPGQSGTPPYSPAMTQSSEEEEISYLKQQAEFLKRQMEEISKKIQGLEKAKK